MKERKITALIREYAPEELPQEYRQLVDAAKAATRRSYAPYSHFHVGAAILLANGETVAGANQENAAFSVTECGERSACFYAASQYPDVPFLKIAIAASEDVEGSPEPVFQKKPISPCGVCRQALAEYEAKQGSDIEVILYGSEAIYILPSVKSLLPLCFTEF